MTTSRVTMMRLPLPFLVPLFCGCAAVTTSPSWVGGGMRLTGPLAAVDEAAIEADLDDEPASADTVAARHILVMHEKSRSRPDDVARTRAEALARAKECLARLKAGADFTELVAEYSDEPGAIERGGDLGAFRRDTMVKPFADAAFALEVGQISDVVETAYGFHIIKRTR